MTNEELIIGHFDKALSAQEETMLEQRLRESAETRTMYDQHKALEAKLAADAAVVEPSSRLDEATIAVALSMLPEAIGGGVLAWFSGKVVIAVTAVVVGGTALAIFSNNSSERTAPIPAPAAHSTPAMSPAPPATQVAPPPPAAVTPPATTEAPTVTAPKASAGEPRVAHTRSSGHKPTLSIDATHTPQVAHPPKTVGGNGGR